MDFKNNWALSFLVILFFFLGFQNTTFAQLAAFKVNSSTKGCAPLTVLVEDISGADPELIFYRFGNAPPQKETTFTFDKPGIYSITQLINTAGSGGDSLPMLNIIEVFAPKVVDFDVIRCANKKVRVQINDDYYDSYKIDFGDNQDAIVGDNEFAEHTYSSENNATITVRGLFEDGAENCTPSSKIITPVGALLPPTINLVEYFEDGSAKIDYVLETDLTHQLELMTDNGFEKVSDILTGSTSFTIQDALPNSVYRISVTDSCSNRIESSQTFYISDINLSGEESYVDISWTIPNGIEESEFVKNTLLKDDNIFDEYTDISSNTIFDEEVVCKITYCYQVETEFSSGLKIISPKRCILAASNVTPPAVVGAYASFISKERIALSWHYPLDGSEIVSAKVTRKDKDGNIDNYIISPLDSVFEDKLINIDDAPYCYSITYKNACDLTSESSPSICPTILRMEGDTDEEEGTLTFEWTPFEGLSTSNYVLEQTDSLEKEPFNTQSVSRSGTYSLDIESQESQTSYVRIRANLNDTTFTYSNTIRIDFRSFVTFPNAFTPNGDNLNDTYGVESKFIKEFKMIIFNRWGEGVFQTNDINGRWDGRYRNTLAPSGEYTMKIVATDQRGREYIFTEMVKLIR
ncbi:gliding motility-associated C-terminal domain-containing protein (plasmid) [Bernardetia sp. Wsw4-3y2]|uniref:T9SS type B sorting domain-containing protein n=1 Tax=Bernardetia sp. Wsw4-3y2 TaxID=3127471 RepID=UPI0030D430F6